MIMGSKETSKIFHSTTYGRSCGRLAPLKFYAVARGRRIGIFWTWEETELLVKGFKGSTSELLHAGGRKVMALQVLPALSTGSGGGQLVGGGAAGGTHMQGDRGVQRVISSAVNGRQ